MLQYLAMLKPTWDCKIFFPWFIFRKFRKKNQKSDEGNNSVFDFKEYLNKFFIWNNDVMGNGSYDKMIFKETKM
jgi:hypothetical protein